MSNFLNNILSRHSAQAVDGFTPHVVEPRLKSRFEADPGIVPPSVVERETELESGVTNGQPAPNQVKRSTARHELPRRNPLSDHAIGLQENQVASLIDTPEKVRQETDITPGKFRTELETGSGAQPMTMQPPASGSREQLQNDSHQTLRTRASPLDLGDGTAPYSDYQPSKISQQANASSDAVISPLTVAERPALAMEWETDSTGMERSEPNEFNKQLLTPDSLQPLGFQAPQWLADIGSDLRNRLGTPTTQESTEPVINVSIGSVEIRTTGEAVPRQAAKRKKPGGIMSLDDYLESRNRRQV